VAARKPVTSRDVAKRAGVSVATVSYVLNDGPRPVSPETQAKVEKAIEELGYFPNELARSLTRKQTATIGLMLPNLINPVYAEIAESFESVCTASGYTVMLTGTDRNLAKEEKLAETLRSKQVDGVVILPSEEPYSFLKLFQQANIPMVVLEHDLANTHCIVIDDLRGGRLAMQHLLSLGHRRIALIERETLSPHGHLRGLGCREVLEESGIPLDPDLVIVGKAGQAAGYAAMQQWLALPDSPTAVFAHNDMLAVGAIRAVFDAGLMVPDDISVVGHDDTTIINYLNPRLTTVKFPVAEMGRRAGQIILELVQQPDSLPAQIITLPVELVVRDSTAPPKKR
jgi:LacI family transcriptional regulator